MIVYAETNFLLEVAYLQERSESCNAILALARQGSVSLVVPAFSIAEARTTWSMRLGERNVLLREQLQPLIRQLSRSQQFITLPEASKELLAAIVASGEDARHRLGFANPAIHDELAGYGCKVLVDFTDAAGYIESVLRLPG